MIEKHAPADITFCATSKSGLGHVRRLTNIAREIQRLRPDTRILLLTNGPVAALTEQERRIYQHIHLVERQEMCAYLQTLPPRCCVVDTAVIPGLHRLDTRLCLILRETRREKLPRFRLEGGRAWDFVLLPNPPDEWRPAPNLIQALRMETVGWIFRKPNDTGAPLPSLPLSDDKARLLLATGGGGNEATRNHLYQVLSRIVPELKRQTNVEVIQALGPRADPLAISGIDHIVRPGPALNRLFSASDLVISTAGYNSVLELAAIDVPALLIPIARTFDDQTARARRWAPRLGWWYDPARHSHLMSEIRTVLARRQRRPPVPLPESGAARAAEILLDLL